MSKPKIIDLCCCAGGASWGYFQAGFEVTGLDIKPQPNYPFKFIQADVLDILKDIKFMSQFNAVHASPPCQGYSNATKDDSKWVHHSKGKQEPKLIKIIRDLLPQNIPYVIENVAGAKSHLIKPFILTGFMFDLPIQRKRYFESNVFIIPPFNRKGNTKKYAEQKGIDYRDMSVTGKSRRTGSIEIWKTIMQMPWAGRAWELSEAIPPAYTKFIGEKLIQHIKNKL